MMRSPTWTGTSETAAARRVLFRDWLRADRDPMVGVLGSQLFRPGGAAARGAHHEQLLSRRRIGPRPDQRPRRAGRARLAGAGALLRPAGVDQTHAAC